jgi:5-methylthioadenosine/S-adenosylhomocysteine deaminase
VPVGARVEHAPEALDALAEAGPRVTPSLGPHAIYTVSEPSLRKIAELSGERGVAVQIHLAETEHEVQDCVATHGVRTVEYLDQVGLLNDRTVIAHGVWLDHDELERVAASGATIVTNPVSNMKLAVGRAFPYRDAHAAGVPIGLGTDGAASNNSLDLLQDVKILALLQKHASADPSVLPAADAWTIATGRQAPRLSGTSIEVGAPADFLLVDDTAVELAPAPLEAALVYSATGAVVDTVVVDGRVLMRNREIDGEHEVRSRALERAHALRG